MTQFLQLLVGGLSLGGVYALLALGFVVVFRASGVVNFAHPALVLVGAYVTARLALSGTLPFAVALLGGVGAAALLALLIQRVLVHPMARKSVIGVSIMTIGVDVVAHTEITRQLGVDALLPMNDPWRNSVVHIAGLTIPQARLAALLATMVLIAGFFAWFRFSTWGIAMRAVADDPPTAALMGVRRVTVTLSPGCSPVCWLRSRVCS